MFEIINKNPLISLLLIVVIFLLLIIIFAQKIRYMRIIKKERSDAIKRSKAVISGQMMEQMAPYLPDFPCHPADAKFLGKPVDFIAFKGLEDSDRVEEILFIEVKTGTSRLSEREQSIRDAIEKRKVRYVEYRI